MVVEAKSAASLSAEFAQWAAEHGKEYTSVEEWKVRQQAYFESKAIVAELNRKA